MKERQVLIDGNIYTTFDQELSDLYHTIACWEKMAVRGCTCPPVVWGCGKANEEAETSRS